MGKNKKKNKRKYSAEPASNETETAAQSASNKSEVETDGKKSSPNPESDLIDETIKQLADAIIECMKVEKRFRKMTHLENEELRQCAMQNICKFNSLRKNLNTLLADRDPSFVEYVEKYMTFKSEISYLKECEAEAYEELQISKKQVDANAPVSIAPAKLEHGPIEADLYSQTDEKENIRDCDISADDIQKEAPTPHNVEGKGSDRYTDDIQAKDHSPQIETEKIKDKKGIHICTEDDSREEKISHSLEAEFDEETRMCINAEIQESWRKQKSFAEMAHAETDKSPRQIKAKFKSFANHRHNLTALLKSHDPESAKCMDKCKNLQSECLRNRSETTAEETVTTPTKYYTNKLQKGEEYKDAYDSVRYVDDSEKSAQTPHTFQDKKRGKTAKDSNISTENIQAIEQILHSRELDYDKTLMKIKENDETKANDIPTVKHSKKTAEITHTEKISEEFEEIQRDWKELLKSKHSKYDKLEKEYRSVETALKALIEKREHGSEEIEMTETLPKDKIQDLTRLSKEAADRVNDLIIELEKAETGKNVNKDNNKSTDDIQREAHSPRSLREELKCTKDSIRSTQHIQTVVHSPKDGTKDKKEEPTDKKDITTRHIQVEDSLVDTELDVDTDTTGLVYDIEECIKKDDSFLETKHSKIMAEKISPKNPKMNTNLDEEKRLIFEKLLALQSSTLAEQEEELNVVESAIELLKKQRDFLYAEKENLISPDKAQYVKEIKKETADDTIEEVSTTVQQPDDCNETVRFEKPVEIHFEFETNGKKRIKVGSEDKYCSFEENRSVILDFKDEKVEVSIIGRQILISTPSSKFGIYVRTPHPVDLKDDATQTQAEP